MARPAQPRLSIVPLLDTLLVNDIDLGNGTTPLDVAVRKGKMNGYLTLSMADEIACRVLKVHPHTVWGDEYEEAVWFDMYDDEEIGAMAQVIPFPEPTKNPEPVYGLRLVA